MCYSVIYNELISTKRNKRLFGKSRQGGNAKGLLGGVVRTIKVQVIHNVGESSAAYDHHAPTERPPLPSVRLLRRVIGEPAEKAHTSGKTSRGNRRTWFISILSITPR